MRLSEFMWFERRCLTMQNATTQQKPTRVFPLGGFFLAVTLVLFLFSSTGRAADVQVVCPGGGPGAFPSVSAALATLDPHGPNNITVTGTCVENIFIDKFHGLFIQSA